MQYNDISRNRSFLPVLVLVLGTMGTFDVKKKAIKSRESFRVESSHQHGLEKPGKGWAWLARTDVHAVLDKWRCATIP